MALKLRIAIDCRIGDSQQGVATALLSLAKALSESQIESQEYTFIVREDMQSWLAPYVYGPCSIKAIPLPRLRGLKVAFFWSQTLRSIVRKLRERQRAAFVPASDGFVESLGFDVVHFPTQDAYLTPLPSIYQPWDLQHRHHPEFFSAVEFARRELHYQAFCRQATFVCVQAQWTRQDVIEQFGLEEKKIAVVPWGSVFDAYPSPSPETIRETREQFGLPQSFFFYPAVTWAHKNHQVIFRALHWLKSERARVPHVFFTGASTEHREVLERLAHDLDIVDQVHFLGFVTPAQLQAVFRTATAMIFPSKFEGFGLPILEAFHSGLPVLSSNATTLPEVAQEGALYFDPDSPEQLGALMETLLDNPQLRQDLIAKGSLVLARQSMRDTVAALQSLYREAAAASRPEPALARAQPASPGEASWQNER